MRGPVRGELFVNVALQTWGFSFTLAMEGVPHDSRGKLAKLK